MALHNFNSQEEKFISIDDIPDFRTEGEKQFSPLSIYDHEKPDIAYAERLSEELVNISGAWMTLYLKEPKGDSDELVVWDEDEDPLYQAGRKMKAYFKPERILVELTRWGSDIPLRATVVFSRAVLMKEVGDRLLSPGDIMELPYNVPSAREVGPFYFRVLNANPDGYFMYRWLYMNAICELITGDVALRPQTNGSNRITKRG